MGKLVIAVFCLVAPFMAAYSEPVEWSPPIAIPSPPFGIKETHRIYDGQEGYRDAGNGPYTIYVDNSASNCSNWGPATEKKPRCDIPTDISKAGTVVEVHGGPYDYHGNKIAINANGTLEKPVFLRGVDDGKGYPSIFNAVNATLQGKYFIIENLIFNKTQVRNGGNRDAPYGRQFIAMRNLEIFGHPRKNGSVLDGEDIVFYNNHVHHNQGDDRHGTSVRSGANRVWILDNYYHHNGGDAIQFCHGCRKAPPRNVYVGRNTMHSDRENAIDLKYGENIIISQNTMYGYEVARPDVRWCFDDDSFCGVYSSGSDGSAIVIGSDGAPTNPWILFNNVSKSAQGIRVEEVYGAWIVGNEISNVSGRAISLEKNGQPLTIIGNTIYGAETGIDQFWRDNFELTIENNIFANIRGLYLDVGVDVARQSSIRNNIFWNNGESIPFRWGRNPTKASTSANLNNRTRGRGNIAADPGFVDAAQGNFNLRRDSAAIGTGTSTLQESDAQFKSYFGEQLSILFDIDGNRLAIADGGETNGASDIGNHRYIPAAE